jgi:hypothetical protein
MDNICKTKTKNECKVSDSCVFLNDFLRGGDDAGPSLDSAEYKRTWTSFTTRIDAMVRVKCRR